MTTKWIPLLLSVMLLLASFPQQASASEQPAFAMTSSASEVKVGDKIEVSITGSHLQDVYGFELRLSYDTGSLRFSESSTSWKGYTVPPIVEGGQVTVAHTKIGNVAGENGQVSFAKLTFEAIKEGEAAVQLAGVKLVNSQVASTTAEPKLSAKVTIVPERAPTVTFSDIQGHWAEKDMLRAAGMGWINGYPDGRFKPEEQVTRAQFTTMLSRALALTAAEGTAIEFADKESIPSYARPHVEQAVTAGIITGFADHTFRPEQVISRAEMTVMVMRALGLPDSGNEAQSSSFADAEQIPSWARAAVAAAAEHGLAKGRGGNRFVPDGTATRAEAVTFILRMLDYAPSI
ncbi:S-layer homology domain-containing protein [Paenibacillus sp. SYP-B4298]|uniref:S-layer homology domain-containing protein n=1 Tax=Paenibacillus sp. SYP-B4298 TaxID=2996034 RepID=UPI0022DDF8EE|nr:S-layer homology domain-containing protein [Paenibacillus sp. SYP-B4298]